ncbi:MAG: cupin domain-containing protein [Synergistaceae bacterium]|nr:cupin domain-containing protein [Synergistaceae bacterium]
MTLKNVSAPIKKDKLGGTGEGSANTYPVPIPDQNGAFVMATRLELDPCASVGYHKHSDDEEVYFIMSGDGLYCEEGVEEKVSVGDIRLCRRGNSHGIRNIGEDPLVLCAAIAKRG